MKNLLAIWRLFKQVRADASANPKKYAKVEKSFHAVVNANTNTARAKAISDLAFAVKAVYPASRKTKAKPKAIESPSA